MNNYLYTNIYNQYQYSDQINQLLIMTIHLANLQSPQKILHNSISRLVSTIMYNQKTQQYICVYQSSFQNEKVEFDIFIPTIYNRGIGERCHHRTLRYNTSSDSNKIHSLLGTQIGFKGSNGQQYNQIEFIIILKSTNVVNMYNEYPNRLNVILQPPDKKGTKK